MRQWIAEELARVLTDFNSAFDAERFLEAANL
jgi:hypothetical protein